MQKNDGVTCMRNDFEKKPPTKWQLLLVDLKKLGWTQKLVAKQCNVTQAAINQLNIGKSREPRHSLGEKLLGLQGIDASEYIDTKEYEEA